jgi:phage gp46-like protein
MDVYQFQTENDGDVLHENGDLVMDAGIRTAAYLSLFGGNKEDGGFDNTQFSWWANFNESDPIYQYRSETRTRQNGIYNGL